VVNDAARVLALAGQRAPTLGNGRLVAVDGPAGSGKTTLADAVAALAGAPVVHLDDLLPGWRGLPRLGEELVPLLDALAADRLGHYRRFDWLADRFAEAHPVAPGPLLVIEGVGAGNRAWSPYVTVLVWVEVPADLRLERGMRRDGEHMRDHWLRWRDDEDALFATEDTRRRADVLVDGTGTSPAVVRAQPAR
jgi:uridine kinase